MIKSTEYILKQSNFLEVQMCSGKLFLGVGEEAG